MEAQLLNNEESAPNVVFESPQEEASMVVHVNTAYPAFKNAGVKLRVPERSVSFLALR